MWRLRIWFMDNVWDRLFPADETPKLVISAYNLRSYRRDFGLSIGAMAKLLCVSEKAYKNWEHHGLHAPDDVEGPASVVINVILKIQEHIKEYKEILDILGYKGKI